MGREVAKFDEQPSYEIVELKSQASKDLEDAVEIIKYFDNYLQTSDKVYEGSPFEARVKAFLSREIK